MTPRDPHQDAGVPGTRPEHGTLPKPTRDDAVGASRTEELRPMQGAEDAADETAKRYATGRTERGDAESSGRFPPHVTKNDEQAPLQAEHESPSDVAALPANASGSEQVSTEAQPKEVEEESMYDQRPEEDKNWTPPES